MPYSIRKQSCKQSDGDPGSYTLSYTDKDGKKHSNCHTSKEKAQAQIGHIEEDDVKEALLRSYIRLLLEYSTETEDIGEEPLQASPEQKAKIYNLLTGEEPDPSDLPVVGQFLDVAVGSANPAARQISDVPSGEHDIQFSQKDIDEVVIALEAEGFDDIAAELGKIKFEPYLEPI